MENIKELDLYQVEVSELNPRKSMNDKNMAELVASVKEQGILQPILVRPDKGINSTPGRHWIICGERRFRAAQEAGLKKIPCIIKDISPQEAYEIALVENLQREDMNPIQEAISYEQALKAKIKTEDLAVKIGKTAPYILNRIKLLSLHEKVQQAILEGKISARHGLVLTRVADLNDQKNIFDQIIGQKLSVAAAENLLQENYRIIKNVLFDTKDCLKCPSNGSLQKDFFDKDTNLKGKCMNRACFIQKTQQDIKKKSEEIKAAGGLILDENGMRKKFGDNAIYGMHYTFSDADRKEEKYKNKCLSCDKHFFFLDKNKHHPDNDRIEEYCMNTRCYHASEKTKFDHGEQESRKEEIAEMKAEERACDLFMFSVRTFSVKNMDDHMKKALTCMYVWYAVMGEKPEETMNLGDLLEKTDKELQALIDKALFDMIRDQQGIEDLNAMAYYFDFDPKKNLILSDRTFWEKCSKADLINHAKALKIKVKESDKVSYMIDEILKAVKPGYIPKEVAKFIKENK